MNVIDDAIASAAAAAKRGPEEFREVVFAEVLRYELLKTLPGIDTGGREPQGRTYAHEMATFEGIEPHKVAEKGNRQMQAVWAVMELSKDESVADNEAIRKKIKDTLSVKPQSRQDTNRTLRKLVPKYLTRKEKVEGQGYEYFPGPDASDIFERLRSESND